MTELAKPAASPEEPASDTSTEPTKARSSMRLIGFFRPTAEQLASAEEFDKWADQVAEIIHREAARVRSSAEKVQQQT
jgi:hypothetical protein